VQQFKEMTVQTLSLFVKRYPFGIFVVLAYLLSWWPALTPQGGLIPHGPMIAAVIVLGITEGRAGLRSWWERVKAQASWRWYLVAAAIPAALALTAAGINLLMGAEILSPVDWLIPIMVLPIMLLLSGMWEEPGWTGFALPHLYSRFGSTAAGILGATLIMGLVRSGWHLPLVLSGSIYWSDFIFVIAFQIVFSWLFNNSGSVLVVMLAHLSSNVIGGELVGSWFEGADWMREAWLRGLLWILLALALLIVTNARLGRRTQESITKGQLGALY
jgi:membrane protease YdiL (CAAX protease family)